MICLFLFRGWFFSVRSMPPLTIDLTNILYKCFSLFKVHTYFVS